MFEDLADNLEKRRETVLIVDDDLMVLQLGQEVLNLYGYEVLTASSEEEALEIHASADNRIALAILDLTLAGGREGLEIAKVLRSHDPAIKTIISSGFDLSCEALDQFESIVDTYLYKPYEMHALAGEVERLLAERAKEVG